MSYSSSIIDSSSIFVADASVMINLNATKHGLDVIRALPGVLMVTENVMAELARGDARGHTDAEEVRSFIRLGAIRSMRLESPALETYASLVEGAALATLDDGEAATLAIAKAMGGVALIDEHKARTLCARRFPNLCVASTIDLLLNDIVRHALGAEGQVDSIVNALRFARMRIPSHLITRVVKLIGDEVAATCPSLPQSSRNAHESVGTVMNATETG